MTMMSLLSSQKISSRRIISNLKGATVISAMGKRLTTAFLRQQPWQTTTCSRTYVTRIAADTTATCATKRSQIRLGMMKEVVVPRQVHENISSVRYMSSKHNDLKNTPPRWQANDEVHQQQNGDDDDYADEGRSMMMMMKQKTKVTAATATATATKNLHHSKRHSSNNIGKYWKEQRRRFLNKEQTPVGSMDTLDWQIGEMLLIHSVEEEEEENGEKYNNNNNNNNKSDDGFELQSSFEILDRLLEEVQATEKGNSDDSTNIPKLDIYHCHALLQKWNRSLRKNETLLSSSTTSKSSSSLSSSKVLSPEMMLQTIEKYFESSSAPVSSPSSASASSASLFRPNIATYTIILDAASRSSDPSIRLIFTEELLLHLIAKSEEKKGGNTNNTNNQNDELRPTIVTFTTLINAWNKTGTVRAARKAETWLGRIFELYASNARYWSNIRPNNYLYTATIKAWATAGRPDRAEQLLERLIARALQSSSSSSSSQAETDDDTRSNSNNDDNIVIVMPDRWAFNTVLAAWSKTPYLEQKIGIDDDDENKDDDDDNDNDDDGTNTTVNNNIEKEKEEITTTTGTTTETAAAETAIEADIEISSVMSSERLLLTMKNLSIKYGYTDCSPDIVSYNCLLGTISKCMMTTMNHDAVGGGRMKNNNSNNTSASKTLINGKLVEKAEMIFNEMIEQSSSSSSSSPIIPDAITYTAMLKILQSSNVPDKKEKAENLFKIAVERKFLKEHEISSLRRILK